MPDSTLFDFYVEVKLSLDTSESQWMLSSRLFTTHYVCSRFHGRCSVWNVPSWEGVKVFDYTAEFGWKRVFRVSSVNMKVTNHQCLFFYPVYRQMFLLLFTQSSLYIYIFFTIAVNHLLCFNGIFINSWDPYVDFWYFSFKQRVKTLIWLCLQLTGNVLMSVFKLKN